MDPQQVARARLEEIRRQDLALVSLDGRYVAQLASKNPGIYDEFQTTTDGSHTFQVTDVLEGARAVARRPANGDARARWTASRAVRALAAAGDATTG